MRVNKAIEDGSLFESPVLRRGVRARRARAPARARLARRRPFAHRPPRALLRFAPEKTWIHAFTDGRDVSPTGRPRPRRAAASTGSRPSPAATTRWTATSAGSGRSSRSTRSSRGVAGQPATDLIDAVRELRRRRHGRVPRADRRRGRAAARAGRHRDLLQLPPRPRRGSSRGYCSTRGFDVTTMTRYAGDRGAPLCARDRNELRWRRPSPPESCVLPRRTSSTSRRSRLRSARRRNPRASAPR